MRGARAVERAGAEVTLTSDFDAALEADGLLVPGVGAYAACMEGLRAIKGERIIGRRPGTGGSSGVDYLDKTTKMRAFTDLWTVRSLLAPSDLFETGADQTYGFTIDG